MVALFWLNLFSLPFFFLAPPSFSRCVSLSLLIKVFATFVQQQVVTYVVVCLNVVNVW